MQAIVQNGYGSTDVLGLKELDTPEPKAHEVLVRVHAASLHAGDYYIMRGLPYPARFAAGWPRPKDYVVGLSLAGTVEAVGSGVTRLQPGDEVFGEGSGACAEYACASHDKVAPKPVNLTFEQAAAMPTSALAALHGIRDAAKVQPGQSVLINGASGGVGTFAVQIAKAFGAEVTGVCSTQNVELVRSIGADHVIDYTRQDFTQAENGYDLILDNVGNRSFADMRRALSPQGKVIPNTGGAGMGYIIASFVRAMFVRQQGRPFLSMPNLADLIVLKKLAEEDQIVPVIDRTYPLDEAVRAFQHLAEGHARGKIVVVVHRSES